MKSLFAVVKNVHLIHGYILPTDLNLNLASIIYTEVIILIG